MIGVQPNAAEAAKQLFEQYKDEVYQYARFTLGNATEAEDVVQEVFLRVLRGWNRFEHRSSTKTWLWSITRNCIKDFLRQKKRTEKLDDVNEPATHDSTLLLELENSLHCLPIPQRQAVILRIIQDKSSAEAAKILGWSEVKLRVTLHRAIKRLQSEFSEQEQKHQPLQKEESRWI